MVGTYSYVPFCSAREGHTGIVRTLLEKGANANVLDAHSRTPLDDAMDGGHQGCVLLLSTYGGRKRARTKTLPTTTSFDKKSTSLFNSNLEIDFSELEMINRIGSGSFGEIYKCR